MISSTAIFACSDIEATLAYYKEILGFGSTWAYGEPPTFGSASAGGATIMFNLNPDLAQKVKGHQHWVKVDEPDELYRRHKKAGAKVVSEIEDKPWGFREYVVEDLNGYFLRFAGPISSSAPASKPFPAEVKLTRRKPTSGEYADVCGKAFGGRQDGTADLLAGTWGGVVALAPSGGTIACLRIMNDAPGWFSIWDVAVVPEWQSQRIGTAIMREAIAMIREVSPRAIVYLFTFKHSFYERLGFGLESASFLRL